MFTGAITALVTPMQEDDEIDIPCLKKLVQRQLKSGIQGLVVNGTTGEAPVLTKNEQQEMLETVVKEVNHKIPVIAGTGSNSTAMTIESTKIAAELGADACLIVTPYYNRPTQEGLYAHYKKIADTVSVPLILYNVPGRTGCDLLPATIKKLSDIANIVAHKECVLTLSRIEALVENCQDRIDLFSGNDEEALGAMLLGFKGIISVAANIVPESLVKLCKLALLSDKTAARQLNRRLTPLLEALFTEPNPVPCKWLLKEMGLIPGGIRLPLTPLSEKYHERLKAVLTKFKLALN